MEKTPEEDCNCEEPIGIVTESGSRFTLVKSNGYKELNETTGDSINAFATNPVYLLIEGDESLALNKAYKKMFSKEPKKEDK